MIEFALQKQIHTSDGDTLLHVNAGIQGGQFIGLYGASGVGKTSVLRMLAGFMKPDVGWLKVNGTVWFDSKAKINLPVQQRNIGFVFQDYALFPNMNVRENIAFAVKDKKSMPIVDELLELMGLTGLAARKIQSLSGGQQQRVALARAIAQKPAILLLDEPLSAVDSVLRAQLQETLALIHQRFSLTTIMVSHNEAEITRLADEVFLLEGGVFKEKQPPAHFFLKESSGQTVSGTVVSVENDGTVVILIEGKQNLKVNDKVEVAVNLT